MGSLKGLCVLLIQLVQYTVSVVNRVLNVPIKCGRFRLTKKLSGNLLAVELVRDLIGYLEKYLAYTIGQ
jgi:hypothetical protein